MNDFLSENTITLKTFYGLEDVLKSELEEFGYTNVEVLNRAVQVKGTWRDVYFLNLNVRCAISVLVQIASFKIKSEEDLYKKALKINWKEYFSVDKTFAVKGAVFSSIFRHSQYPFLLVKDAIVDTFRKNSNERPNVNVKSPQVLFDVYINNENVTVSLNTSGVPLFQRGYRQSVGEAPLNEVVAAGLIKLSGWNKKEPFIDPFCGSGTLLIEAALIAANIPPCIERFHYAFKNFVNFNPDVWDDIYNKAEKKCNTFEPTILGFDQNPDMVLKAKRNLRGLPIGRFLKVEISDFQSIKELEISSGVMISNPPYGERMGEGLEELYEELGDFMKNKLKGFECWIISSNVSALKSVGLKPSRKMRLFNGDLECSFRRYSIYEGSKKGKYIEQ